MKVRILYYPNKTIKVIASATQDPEKMLEVFNDSTPAGIEYDDIETSLLPDSAEKKYWCGSKEDGVYIDTDQEVAYQAEISRQEEHNQEKTGIKGKTLKYKENWAKDRLNETTLDNQSKIGIGKILRKILAFTE